MFSILRNILSIGSYTFIENFRNRLYYIVVFFGGVMLASSVLFGSLAIDQELRVILDFGLATIELFGLATAVFASVTLILSEIESRTLYLILTRPVSRTIYLVGRFVGLLFSITAAMVLMAIFLFVILIVKGWSIDLWVLVAVPLMMCKVMIISALAIFLSLFSTSAMASVVFTGSLWILGHFIEEMRFMAEEGSSLFVSYFVEVVAWITPNFQYLNVRDFMTVALSQKGLLCVTALGYSLLYTLVMLFFSDMLLKRKEF